MRCILDALDLALSSKLPHTPRQRGRP